MTKLGEVVDLFCGIGGLSYGFKKAGFQILAGFDVDASCKFAFEKNNKATMHISDVGLLSGREISSLYSGTTATVLAGCAPCQPFSKYKHRYEDDPRWNLVGRFAEIAAEAQTDFVTMENVPQLLRYKKGKVFDFFCETLRNAGYQVWFNVENARDYGVPQNRERLVLMAAKGSITVFPVRSERLRTVRDAIGGLRSIEAGEVDLKDSIHRAARLSDKNLKRIRSSIQGGSWRDWPKNLVADCHLKPSGTSYGSVYGRMSWDKPAPTMTTQCYGFGNGRFGHPEQDRAISLREAALIQSFPSSYEFVKSESEISMKSLGRWIGNAVPVELARGIAAGVAVGAANG